MADVSPIFLNTFFETFSRVNVNYALCYVCGGLGGHSFSGLSGVALSILRVVLPLLYKCVT